MPTMSAESATGLPAPRRFGSRPASKSAPKGGLFIDDWPDHLGARTIIISGLLELRLGFHLGDGGRVFLD